MPLYLRGSAALEAPKRAISWYLQTGLPFHVCGSEGNLSCRYVESLGATYIEVKQRRFSRNSGGDDHLRKKFNDSIATHGEGYDWYCLVGADDLVSLEFFDKLPDTKVPTMAGVSMDSPLVLHHLQYKMSASVHLDYYNKYDLLPGVNAFNRAAMRACMNRPYQMRGCETGAEQFFAASGDVFPIPGYVVMLKEDGCLNNFTRIIDRHRVTALTDFEQKTLDEVLQVTGIA